MYKISMLRPLLICAILALGGATTGCDGDNSKINNGDNNAEAPDADTTPDTTPDPVPDVVSTPDIVDEPDVAAVPGPMTGPWIATNNEDDSIISYFDLADLEGNPKVTGGYLTGPGLYDGLFEGGPGDLVDSSLNGTTLTLKWNPTTQESELFTLNASKVDDDTFTGHITAVENVSLNLDVTLARNPDAPGQ